MPERKIIVLGGGFGGIRTALALSEESLPDTKIILISDKPHFEYMPALYRVVAGSSPLEVCIPLRDIFEGTRVEVLVDKITEVDLGEKKLSGVSGSHYIFDYCVLALGAETNYFNIPGLEELSFGFKSITEALKLKRHLHEAFESCESGTKEDKVCLAHIVIIGGGPTGVELAGELSRYTKELAKRHKVDESLVTIDLIEASPRLLSMLPEDFAKRVSNRLRRLGVNVFLNRTLIKEEMEDVYMKDMKMKTKTVIWAAGVKPNHLFRKISGLELDRAGRVLVNEFMEAKGFRDVFVIGDAASTAHSGMAQTANNDGEYAARVILARIKGRDEIKPYKQPAPYHAVPVGLNWAGAIVGPFKIYGLFGWWLRRLADLRFFLSILSVKKAWHVFRDGKMLSESCPVCLELLRESQEEFK